MWPKIQRYIFAFSNNGFVYSVFVYFSWNSMMSKVSAHVHWTKCICGCALIKDVCWHGHVRDSLRDWWTEATETSGKLYVTEARKRERRQGEWDSEPFLVNEREDKYAEAWKGISLAKGKNISLTFAGLPGSFVPVSLSMIKHRKRAGLWMAMFHSYQ